MDQSALQRITSYDIMRSDAESILTQCQSHNLLMNSVLLSAAKYRDGLVWFFEYGENLREADPDGLPEGGSFFVAVDARTGGILAAWLEE